jgi:hypothetical protein
VTESTRHRWRTAPPALLVTGVPRSGTTWLARVLAGAPGMALTGREPMNPRDRQYALGGTLPGWATLTEPTRRQQFLLRTAYRGLNPFVYSRYGHRQWAAALPGTRVVVKDPFALISLPAIHAATGARPVLVYRHPAAVLASYRRMGWTADLDEVAATLGVPRGPLSPPSDVPPEALDAWDMAQFWRLLHDRALHDLTVVDSTLVVSHEALAAGGDTAMRRVFEVLDLAWSVRVTDTSVADTDPTALHNLQRAPETVARSWRSQVSVGEIELMERVSGPALRKLQELSVALS